MVPVPFVVALLLLVLLGAHYPRLQQTHTGRLFAIALCLHAVGSFLIGLRWWLDWPAVMPFAAVIAVALSALQYLAFRSLGGRHLNVNIHRDWVHGLPVVLVTLARFIDIGWVDIVLAGTKILYAGLLIGLIRRAPESLTLVRLGWLNHAIRALWVCVALLLLGVVIDMAIAIDFAFYGGRIAAPLVSVVNVFVLATLAWLIIAVGRSRSLDEGEELTALPVITSDSSAEKSRENDAETAPVNENDGFGVGSDSPGPSVGRDHAEQSYKDNAEGDVHAETKQVYLDLEEFVQSNELYKDPELNLQRLSRKLGVPSRKVSRAINVHTGGNISQWINQARINAACEMLRQTDISIQQAMFDAGFTTKSNFNREFRRVHNCSPTQWRLEQSS